MSRGIADNRAGSGERPARVPTHLRKGDTVMVIAGKERGKTGKLLRVIAEKNRATVERLNMVKRHRKGRGVQSPGGILEKEAALHLSNLMIMCERCNKPTRIGAKRLDDGKSVRVCRRCGEQLERA
jgi:large subunit ribosomal protein L24